MALTKVQKEGIETLINNNADNRVITGSGTANTLEGEANLTFSGNLLHLNSGNSGLPKLRLQHTGAGNDVFEITGGLTGVSNGGFGIYDVDASAYRLAIDSSGKLAIGTTTPYTYGIATFHDSNGIVLEGSSQGRLLFRDTGGGTNLKMFDLASSDGVLKFRTIADNGTTVTERMRIDSAGRVGIGLTNPVNNLDVSGSISATGNMLNTAYADGVYIGTEGGLPAISAGKASNSAYAPLVFSQAHQAAGAERMRIDSSGNVLIGRSDTTGIPASGNDLVVSKSGNMGLTIQSTDSSYSNLYYADSAGGNPAGYISYQHSTDSLQFATATSERMRIASDGDIGIGTSNPGQRLHVYNSATDSHCYLKVENNRSRNAAIQLTTTLGSWYVGQGIGSDTDRFSIYDTTDRFVIDANSRIYTNTTSQGPHGGHYNIDGSGDSVNTLNVKGNTGNYVVISSSAKDGGHHIYFSNRQSGSHVNTGTITDNNSNVSYNTSSDYRIKENIVSISDGITRLKQLNPVRHTFKNNSSAGTVDGWIAHELDTVCPYAVNGEKDAVNEDGTDNLQGVDYGRITPLLTAALKEAITKIETLETKVAALEAA